MAMGECSVYSSLQLADSKVKFAACNDFELAVTWRWPTLAQRNHGELSHMAVVIIIIIINLLV